MRFKGKRPVGVLSAAGELVLSRRYFWGEGAGGCYPSDERAGIAASTVTAGARELCCVMGMASDFRSAAAANLRRVGGLAVCPERLRQVVEAEAARATTLRDAGVVAAGWSAADAALEKGRLYVGVDGLLVRTVTAAEKDKRRRAHAGRRRLRGRRGVGNRKPLPPPLPGTDQTFKEVKFALFYDQPKGHRHAVAGGGDAKEMGRLLRRHAAQVGIDHARQKLGLTDGAPWIARQLEANLPMLDARRLLDFYHLAQHVHQTANASLGEGTAAAKAWAHARLHEARHHGPAPVLAAVATLGQCVRRSPDKRESLRRLKHYVADRLDMLDYPAARRRGWDIGSGPTESMGKNLAARVKGVGMKWDLSHAADLMNLKALYESGQSRTYWERQAAEGRLN